MLTPARSYEDVYGGFRWPIPGSYNIGYDVCDRHAGDPTRRVQTGGRGQDDRALSRLPLRSPSPTGTLVNALARAWRWQKLLDDGVCAPVSEIGDAENISKGYVSRILRLALLAPEVVETIIEGRASDAVMLEGLERPLPASWAEQRAKLAP